MMPDTYEEWVARKLEVDEPEPFCPFYGPSRVFYCNRAYSDKCVTCEEARGEWEAEQDECPS